MTVLEHIKKVMKLRNISQKEVCDYLNISQQAFTNWNNGNNSSYMKHIPEIAKCLDVSIDFLVSGFEEEPPSPFEYNSNFFIFGMIFGFTVKHRQI
jgi:transcriptional regulator with XRE-family HTH domain